MKGELDKTGQLAVIPRETTRKEPPDEAKKKDTLTSQKKTDPNPRVGTPGSDSWPDIIPHCQGTHAARSGRRIKYWSCTELGALFCPSSREGGWGGYRGPDVSRISYFVSHLNSVDDGTVILILAADLP